MVPAPREAGSCRWGTRGRPTPGPRRERPSCCPGGDPGDLPLRAAAALGACSPQPAPGAVPSARLCRGIPGLSGPWSRGPGLTPLSTLRPPPLRERPQVPSTPSQAKLGPPGPSAAFLVLPSQPPFPGWFFKALWAPRAHPESPLVLSSQPPPLPQDLRPTPWGESASSLRPSPTLAPRPLLCLPTPTGSDSLPHSHLPQCLASWISCQPQNLSPPPPLVRVVFIPIRFQSSSVRPQPREHPLQWKAREKPARGLRDGVCALQSASRNRTNPRKQQKRTPKLAHPFSDLRDGCRPESWGP